MEDPSKTFIRSLALLNSANNRLSIELDALRNREVRAIF